MPKPVPSRVLVLGVGPGGRADLPERRIADILAADLLMASKRHLEEFPEFPGETLAITGNVQEVAERCAALAGKKNVVVLGSGDPNFFGIGRYLAAKVGMDKLTIQPAASSMQEAFARAGLPWHEAAFATCHGRPIEQILQTVRDNPVTGLFTDPDNTPQNIARTLLDAGLPDMDAWVCADLGMATERVETGRLSDFTGKAFPALNVMILKHDPPPARKLGLGLPEEAFSHRKPKRGLITKAEVRAVAISKLALGDRSVVWDIGAGSGSVAVECAGIAHKGRVFAVEKNAEDAGHVEENIARFGRANLTAVHGTAPEALEGLPDPDAVFVGGTGGGMERILDTCLARLTPGGRLVMTLVTLENIAAAHGWCKARALAVEMVQLQVSRGTPILDMTRLEALNPVTVLTVTRPPLDSYDP